MFDRSVTTVAHDHQAGVRRSRRAPAGRRAIARVAVACIFVVMAGCGDDGPEDAARAEPSSSAALTDGSGAAENNPDSGETRSDSTADTGGGSGEPESATPAAEPDVFDCATLEAEIIEVTALAEPDLSTVESLAKRWWVTTDCGDRCGAPLNADADPSCRAATRP